MMETTVNSGMCRCCASEGLFKDVNSTYHWMGEDEVYAEMLQFCFDVTLTSAEDLNNGGICEVCITQLRNAANFKKQVQHTEEQFKKRLQELKTFKSNLVKVEMSVDDGANSDNNLSEDYQSEFEVPIKEESPEPKPKKRAAKATASKAKKAKTDSGETSTKRDVSNSADSDVIITDVSVTINYSDSENEDVVKDGTEGENSVTIMEQSHTTETLEEPIPSSNIRELDKHLHNVMTILSHSNANPIRNHSDLGFACYYCDYCYQKPIDLKRHTLEQHGDSLSSKFKFRGGMTVFLVKLDITSLCCNICEENITQLDTLIEHLRQKHDKEFYTDINNHILPFKFAEGPIACVICSKNFKCFNNIQKHMSVHYNNYVCDTCNAPFVNKRSLNLHEFRQHKPGNSICTYCPKAFNTQDHRVNHEYSVHTPKTPRYKCQLCLEKFSSYTKKMDHMVQKHGAQPVILKCTDCDRTFRNTTKLSLHRRRDHLQERKYECSECDSRFYSKTELTNHVAGHSGEREHQCYVCDKYYPRKHTLLEHMRIHRNDRRFKCNKCGQDFVQKCTWKNHMRYKHGEFV